MLKQLLPITLALSTFLWLAGCDNAATHDDHDHGAEEPAAEAHDHGEEGPRGGHLIELDDGAYHAELLHDEATHTVTVHLLDETGKQDAAVDATEFTLQLFDGDAFTRYALKPAGGATPASQFALVDEILCDQLSHSHAVKGRLSMTIHGEQYVGVLEHHAHDHEGHDHGDHDHREPSEEAHEGHDHEGHDQGDHNHAGHDHG